MPKIFYVTETTTEYTAFNFFKTEREALKYGKSQLADFRMKKDTFEDDLYDKDNDKRFGGEWIYTPPGGLLISYQEDRAYIQSADDEEARKFIKDEVGSNGIALFFDKFRKGMHCTFNGNSVEGKGFKWEWDGNKINEKTQIKNKIKSKMKHVKLFEDFTNLNFTKKDAKKLIKDLKKDGYDASGDENWIQVDGVDSPNPDYDGTVSMAWDPSEEEAYSDDDTYEDPVTTAEDFTDLVYYPEDTFGKWD